MDEHEHADGSAHGHSHGHENSQTHSHDHDHSHDHHHKHGNAHDHHHDHDHDFTDRAERLNDPIQYRYLSAEELREFLDPAPDWVVADLGSGTGFYTDEIAPIVDVVYAVDAFEGMHEHYRDRGVPENVELVTANVQSTPLNDDELDGAVSLRTFHHGVSDSLNEVARILRPGGRLVVVDWSATSVGDRERGPAPEECFDLATVQTLLLEHGFKIQYAQERRETFVVVATLRSD